MHPADTLVICCLAGAPNIFFANIIIPSLCPGDLLPSDAPKNVPFVGLELPVGIPLGVHIHVPLVLFFPFCAQSHCIAFSIQLCALTAPSLIPCTCMFISPRVHLWLPSMHTLSCMHNNSLYVYFNCQNIGGYPLVRCIQSKPLYA